MNRQETCCLPADGSCADENPFARGPLVSVVICVYNAGEYLRPSLLSIIGQTHRNLQILIIDDGSTDGCFDTVADLVADARVEVLHQANASKPVAMNRALDLVRGEFYAVQDADDISHPRRIELQVRAMLQNPDLAAVYAGHEVIIDRRSMAPVFAARSTAECRHIINDFLMPALDPTGMYRMSLVGKFRYDASLPSSEGHDYILRIGEQYPMLVLGECLYGYRIQSGSLTRRDPARRDQLVQVALRKACERRHLDYAQLFSPKPRRVTKSSNAISDNNLFTHFIQSVVDQRRAGLRLAAIQTGYACLCLHPLDPVYYKAILHALLPIGVIEFLRRRAAALR
jgi:glycosyltransferase involved in cell wall biosynthesis